jgi:hypothetical protein
MKNGEGAVSRRRVRLVPEDCVEIFEIRLALFFTADGRRHVGAVVSDPSERDLEVVDLIELRGAMDLGRDLLLAAYTPRGEGE